MRFAGHGPWELPVVGFEVGQLSLGAFVVDIVAYGLEGASATVRLEDDFELRQPDGSRRRLAPGSWEPLAPLLALRGDTLQLVRFTGTSELRVEFASGYVITSWAKGSYEKWELQAPGGVLVIGKGGGPDIYDGEPENTRRVRWNGTRFVPSRSGR